MLGDGGQDMLALASSPLAEAITTKYGLSAEDARDVADAWARQITQLYENNPDDTLQWRLPVDRQP
jgi:hypothetical protein